MTPTLARSGGEWLRLALTLADPVGGSCGPLRVGPAPSEARALAEASTKSAQDKSTTDAVRPAGPRAARVADDALAGLGRRR
jgi:hypothetical protein